MRTDLGRRIIAVHGKAREETGFTSVEFYAEINKIDTTGPAAKKQTQSLIDQILEVVKKHTEEGKIENQRLKTTFEVSRATRYDQAKQEQVFVGYKAKYQIRFTALNVAFAIKIHDDLTSIDGVEAASPHFRFAEDPEVEKRAFAGAFAQAEAKFKMQCEVTKLKREDYEVISWTVDEDRDGGGKGLAVGRGDGITLDPGKAVREVGLTVSYAPKNLSR